MSCHLLTHAPHPFTFFNQSLCRIIWSNFKAFQVVFKLTNEGGKSYGLQSVESNLESELKTLTKCQHLA